MTVLHPQGGAGLPQQQDKTDGHLPLAGRVDLPWLQYRSVVMGRELKLRYTHVHMLRQEHIRKRCGGTHTTSHTDRELNRSVTLLGPLALK